jgi:antibiotic biosynthesis monooxygenase (ABM) superfamily enzyme
MTHKERFILGATMSSMMVFMVTLVATYLNLGPRPDFVLLWAKAYIVAWPVAACTAYLVMPLAQRVTKRIVGRPQGHV